MYNDVIKFYKSRRKYIFLVIGYIRSFLVQLDAFCFFRGKERSCLCGCVTHNGRIMHLPVGKCKAIPLQALTGPSGSSRFEIKLQLLNYCKFTLYIAPDMSKEMAVNSVQSSH